MKRPNIYFKDGKIHANTTKDKLLVSLPTISNSQFGKLVDKQKGQGHYLLL